MVIAMAGLPGTGKTTLAAALAQALDGLVLAKDPVRFALFGAAVDYSAAQDDLVMAMLYDATAYLLAREPERPIIIDGRTFTNRAAVAALVDRATAWRQPLLFVRCTCDAALARARVAGAVDHPATNRTPALLERLAAREEPLAAPHVTIDTGRSSTAEAVRAVRSALGEDGG